MPAKSSSKGTPAEKALVITRVFDAPRDRVWEAWTDSKQMAKWWGPHGFTNPVFEMDVRPGGAILIHMKNPYDKSELPVTGTFVEVVKPEKLVFTHGVWGNENLNTVTFSEQNGKTTMRLEMVFTKLSGDPAQALAGAKAGLNQSLDRLSALLSESPELVITRVFDAPRDLVWKAWTDPEHVKRWWGPKTFTSPVCKMDFRVGGKYLYSMQSPEFGEGRIFWSTGIYREIVPIERIVATDSFADEKGNVVPATHYGMSADIPLEMLVTVTFEEHNRKTKMTLRHAGIPAGPDSEGANQGWNESFDKLAEHLATLAKEKSRGRKN